MVNPDDDLTPEQEFLFSMVTAIAELEKLKTMVENVDASNRLRRQQIIRSLPNPN